MSAKIMGEVYDLDLTTTEQAVLLALADHADHNGDNAHPGIELLVWKTGISARHVKRLLERLEAARIIVPRPSVQGGRGRTTVYSIRLCNGAKKPPFTRALPAAKSRRRGDTLTLFSDAETVTPCHRSGAETVTQGHPLGGETVTGSHRFVAERVTGSPTKGDSESVKGDSESTPPIRARLNHQEPSYEPEERGGARAPRPPVRSGLAGQPPPPLPPSLPPSVEEVSRYLAEIGQPGQHAALFHAYYDERDWVTGADRRPIRDWRKKLRTWLAREAQFAPRNPQARGGPSTIAGRVLMTADALAGLPDLPAEGTGRQPKGRSEPITGGGR